MKPSEIFEGENSSLKKTFDIATNNNWQQKFENLIKEVYSEEVFGSVDENLIPKDAVMAATMRAMAKSIGHIVAPVFEDLLTKKDQEHKAELERIVNFIDKNYLEYCRQQNGMDYCKNCGLNKEDIIKSTNTLTN